MAALYGVRLRYFFYVTSDNVTIVLKLQKIHNFIIVLISYFIAKLSNMVFCLLKFFMTYLPTLGIICALFCYWYKGDVWMKQL